MGCPPAAGRRCAGRQEICPADLSDHLAVAFDPVVTQMILNGLDPRHTKPVTC